MEATSQEVTRRTCVFCGGSPCNRHHLIAEQIGKLFPPEDQRKTAIRRTDVGEGWDHQEFPAFTFRQKARITCESCNGGWMSGLENEAVKTLRWMMFDKQRKCFLTIDQQAALAAWSVMTVLVIQTAKMIGGKEPIPEAHFRHLRDHHRPPDTYRVAIGLRQRDWAWPVWTSGLGTHSPSLGPGPFVAPHRFENINTYEAALCVGHFVAYVVASLKDAYVLDLPTSLSPAMVQIFPTTTMAYWPREFTLTTDQIREHFHRSAARSREPPE